MQTDVEQLALRVLSLTKQIQNMQGDHIEKLLRLAQILELQLNVDLSLFKQELY